MFSGSNPEELFRIFPEHSNWPPVSLAEFGHVSSGIIYVGETVMGRGREAQDRGLNWVETPELGATVGTEGGTE